MQQGYTITPTGNWYIDSGIVGAIWLLNNLDDRLYSEDFVKKILEVEEPLPPSFLVDYAFAYWHRRLYENLTKKGKKKGNEEAQPKLDELTNDIKERHKRVREAQPHNLEAAKGELEEFVAKYSYLLNENFRHLFSLSRFFLKNFDFENPSKSDEQRVKDFFDYLNGSSGDSAILDKALLKLLPSFEEFSNEFIGKMSLKDFAQQVHPLAHVFLISAEWGFAEAPDGALAFFHSPDLWISYRMRRKLESHGLAFGKKDVEGILVSADELNEIKARWVLDNLLLVELWDIDFSAQSIGSVSYLPFNRRSAAILLSDEGGSLNGFMHYIALDRVKVNGLEGLAEGRPLSPYALEYLKGLMSSDCEANRAPGFLLYWAALDIANSKKAYDEEAAVNYYRTALSMVRGAYIWMGQVLQAKASAEKNYKKLAKRLGLSLFSYAMAGDHNTFVNEALRFIESVREIESASVDSRLLDFLLEMDGDSLLPRAVPLLLAVCESMQDRGSHGPSLKGAGVPSNSVK